MKYKLKSTKLNSTNTWHSISSEEVLNQEFIDHFSAANNEQPWLRAMRMEALKKAALRPTPLLRYGTSIMLNIAELNIPKLQERIRKSDFNLLSFAEEKNWENLKKQGIIICTLEEAALKYPKLVHESFMRKQNEEKEVNEEGELNSKFSYLHKAYMNKTLFVYVPKNYQAEKPLEITSIAINDVFEYILIIADENARLTIIEQAASNTNSYMVSKEINNVADSNQQYNLYRSAMVEFIVKQNAELTYCSLQSLPDNYYNIHYATAHVAENGAMNWLTVTLGSKFTKQVLSTTLHGKGSRTNNFSFFLADASQQFDFYSPVIHKAEQTQSVIIAKGAVKDKSKVVYRGLIHIKENATNAAGYQKEDNIILNEGAEVDAIPTLYIDNNNVKCSHGATIGQLDDEKLFYMQSRGIEEETAKKIIVEGFFESLINNLPDKKLSKEVFDAVSIEIEKKLDRERKIGGC